MKHSLQAMIGLYFTQKCVVQGQYKERKANKEKSRSFMFNVQYEQEYLVGTCPAVLGNQRFSSRLVFPKSVGQESLVEW